MYTTELKRENYEVYNLAVSGLQDAVAHDNFIAFVHFHDPDDTGHHLQDHAEYMEAALRVDRYIWGLMKSLTPGTDVTYCSDHGFSFKELGDAENSHRFCPWGTLATNFPVLNVP
ncbi:MAG: hypothetical protein GTN74_16180 [Proteobacteria bacterium]|nr:hypothetical protein [Pseudomonadota bacterium]NIS72232.1 hypothetical protein [Pseudomonadota bacterium]